MAEEPARKIWLPSPELLIFLGVVVVIAAITIPGLLSSRRASNERSASSATKTLTSAEADFRANDRDGNHVNDFWTGDVSGLYYVTPSPAGPPLRLIEESLANSDPEPLFALTQPGARQGYFTVALDRDNSLPGKQGEYRADTDHSGRKVHHESKFGFCSFPESSGAGHYQFKVDESNTVFRESPSKPRSSFPSAQELEQY